MFVLIGCKDDTDNVSSVINSYPMNIGTEWIYGRQIIIEKYNNSGLYKIGEVDSIDFITNVSIVKDTILNDTMNVTVFKSQDENNTWISKHYYYIDNEGLRNYAYSNGGAFDFPNKNQIQQIPNLETIIDKKLSTNGDLYFEIPPTLNIKFPLKVNNYWTYREPSVSGDLQIDKEVVGIEYLTLFEKNFKCFKVNYIYLNNSAYEGIEMTDWISGEGLIKRQTLIDSVTVTNDIGEPLYTAKIKDLLILKELILK